MPKLKFGEHLNVFYCDDIGGVEKVISFNLETPRINVFVGGDGIEYRMVSDPRRVAMYGICLVVFELTKWQWDHLKEREVEYSGGTLEVDISPGEDVILLGDGSLFASSTMFFCFDPVVLYMNNKFYDLCEEGFRMFKGEDSWENATGYAKDKLLKLKMPSREEALDWLVRNKSLNP